MPLPTLQLSLRLDRADVFGSLEWVLANARRTGLSLLQLNVAEPGHAVSLRCSAPTSDLLHLFVRRFGYGIEVEILDAEFPDDIGADAERAEQAEEAEAVHA